MLKYIKMTRALTSVMCSACWWRVLSCPSADVAATLAYSKSAIRCVTGAIPFDNVDDEQIQKPQRWNPRIWGALWSSSDRSARFSIFCVLPDVVGIPCQHAGNANAVQSGWFVVGLLSQTLIVHMIRPAVCRLFRAVHRGR